MPWGLLPAREEVHRPSCGEGGTKKGFLGKGILEALEVEDHLMRRDKMIRSGRWQNSMMSGEFYLQLISLEWKVRSSVGEGLGWRHLQTGLGFMLAPKKASWNVHWMFRKPWPDEIMFLNIIWKSATYLILSGFVGFLFVLVWFFLTEWHVGFQFLNQGSNMQLLSNLL